MKCRLIEQGLVPGNCSTFHNGSWKKACDVTLRWENETPYRLIHSYAHKAPEQYLSIYQSGCNWSCQKCHSWRFSKHASGKWMSPEDIVRISKDYVQKNWDNLYKEPKNHVTSWHAHELCHSCGSCITQGKRSRYCPEKLRLDQITMLDDLTWGPARNIISFTGGDLACQPEFYSQTAKGIKDLKMDLWVLFETNGYGLTAENLDTLDKSGVDSFWLDIKAYDDKIHRRLTGSSNQQVLDLPVKITDKGFMLEVSSVYIPGWVERDQIESIAQLLANVDSSIPYAIIAFFPENKLKNVRSPSYNQMFEAFKVAKNAGLENVKLGNLGRFVKNFGEYEQLFKMGAI